MRRSSPLSNAPGLLGAFAFLLAVLPTACEEKNSPPPWQGETVAEETAAMAAAAEVADADQATESSAADEFDRPDATELRFVAYNLKNWLSMDRYVDRQPVGSKPKPEKERDAAVAIIARARPDILGICEIGQREDLVDLQTRLKAAGLDLPHTHHTGGADDTRRLALLSRFPISSTQLHEDLTYKLENRTRGMGRGILDATVETPRGEIRFLGTHLKSKREIPDGDQEMMRRAEAHLLRREADRILSKDPDTRMIVYGDMNDTRQASAIRIIRGPQDGAKSLKMAYLRDSRGETWTHHWSYQDVYSRFDYIFVTPTLLDSVDWDDCRILDDPEWSDASDHRALLLVIE